TLSRQDERNPVPSPVPIQGRLFHSCGTSFSRRLCPEPQCEDRHRPVLWPVLRLPCLALLRSATDEAVHLPGVNELDGEFSRKGEGVPQMRFKFAATGAVACVGSIAGKTSTAIALHPGAVAKSG